jgi:hypothetical protein
MVGHKAVGPVRWALALATVTAGVAVAGQAPALAGAACQFNYLPVPDGTVNSFVDGGDPTGAYVAGSASVIGADGLRSRVNLLWTDGRFTEVRSSYAGGAGLTDVNSSGVAVGTGRDGEARSHAFTYHQGVVRELPSPQPGLQTEAVAINSRGDVLGNVVDPDSDWFERPVVWPAGRPGAVRLWPVEEEVTAVDIDDDGTVVAQPGGVASPSGAIVWRPDGTVTELPPATAGATSIVVATRHGWAAGWENAPGASTALRWNLGTGSVTTVPEVWLVSAVDGRGAVGGQDFGLEPVIVRRSGAVVHPSVPEGLRGGVKVLAQHGLAYGFVEGQAAMWRGC